MYLASLYLYSNKIEVFTNLSTVSQNQRFRKVYNRNLKIYRSADNRIEIRIKNGDQRAASIGENIPVFTLIAGDTQKQVLQKDCEVRDSQQGIVFVDLTRDELERLEQGFYNYGVSLEARQILESGQLEYTVDRRQPLYVDSHYGAIGSLEIAGNLNGTFQDTVELTEFLYINPIGLGEQEEPFFVSSSIDAQPTTSTPQSLHTFQFYFTDYTGRVTVEASLEPQGATPAKWITVDEFEPATSETTYRTVEGKYTWFRIKHFPTNISLPKDGPIEVKGTLDKVLYR